MSLPLAFLSSPVIVSVQLLLAVKVTDLPVSAPSANNLTVSDVGR
jgi:hypothetical protein